jgi:hypothetical protein
LFPSWFWFLCSIFMLNSFCVFSIHFNLILFYALGPTPTSGHHFEQQPTVGARPTKKSLEKNRP